MPFAVQFGQFDLAVAAIRRRGRLFDGKSQRAVHKWETQDTLLLQITRPVPKRFYEWKNERKIGIVRDRLDPFQGAQETEPSLMMLGQHRQIFRVGRRPAQRQ